jgi:hypothetical protein
MGIPPEHKRSLVWVKNWMDQSNPCISLSAKCCMYSKTGASRRASRDITRLVLLKTRHHMLGLVVFIFKFCLVRLKSSKTFFFAHLWKRLMIHLLF